MQLERREAKVHSKRGEAIVHLEGRRALLDFERSEVVDEAIQSSHQPNMIFL